MESENTESDVFTKTLYFIGGAVFLLAIIVIGAGTAAAIVPAI